MARDKITIWNQALSYVGVKAGVQSDTEDTEEVQHLNSVWDLTRDVALEAFEWNFLKSHVALAALSEDAPDAWEYVYQWPSGCMKVRYIEPVERTDDPIAFEIGNGTGGSRVIFTDEESAILWYSKRVDNPELWSAAFCDALAWGLAASIAMTSIGSVRDSAGLSKRYEQKLMDAMVLSANEEQRDAIRDAEGIRDRE